MLSYSPQTPVPLSNGTSIIEAQVETVVDMVSKLESEKAKKIEATKEAEAGWRSLCDGMAEQTLLKGVDGFVLRFCNFALLLTCATAGGIWATSQARSHRT